VSDEIQIMRQTSLVDAELKGRMFRGYAAVFDTPWDDNLTEKFGYIEKVARGAFRKALSSKDNVPFLLGHDRNMVLGTTGSGNVKITEEPKGLLTQAKLPDNHLGEYARSMIESGDLRGMSFGVKLNRRSGDIERSRSGNGIPIMTIRNARKMHDVSLTWEPSYPDSTVLELRSQGFVAIPLQEPGEGEETQPTASGNDDQSPDEQTAWWVEPSAEAETQPFVPWWELLARQLEKEN
jgi:HK97 family phage prohead protease